jgi:hypothetical protein
MGEGVVRVLQMIAGPDGQKLEPCWTLVLSFLLVRTTFTVLE